MESIDEVVRVNIYIRMRHIGMNQKELAGVTGLTTAYINKLLKGKKPVSKSKSLPLIASRLGVPEVDLYQDPKASAVREAVEKAHRSALGDQKRMTKMFQDQLLETIAELKATQARAADAPQDDREMELLDLFRSATPDQRAVMLSAVKAVVKPTPKNSKTRATVKKA
jgi:transcriptional regulator with XRE-family HTH domain